MKSIVVNVPDGVHHEFKMYALSNKKTMTEILTETIIKTLHDEEENNEKPDNRD